MKRNPWAEYERLSRQLDHLIVAYVILSVIGGGCLVSLLVNMLVTS